MVSALRETGLLDNTVVIFTADHGELAMEHRQFYKMSMFEGSSHVPLLVTGPGLMSGLQVNELVSLVDLYPTVLGKEVDRNIRSKCKGLTCYSRLHGVCQSNIIKALVHLDCYVMFCRHCWYISKRHSQWPHAHSAAVQGPHFLQEATSRLGSQ